MLRNKLGQYFYVIAFNASGRVSGDAANITCTLSIDGGARGGINDGNPTEIGTSGMYRFTLSRAETNGHELSFDPESATGGVQVLGAPSNIMITALDESAVIAAVGRTDIPSGAPGYPATLAISDGFGDETSGSVDDTAYGSFPENTWEFQSVNPDGMRYEFQLPAGLVATSFFWWGYASTDMSASLSTNDYPSGELNGLGSLPLGGPGDAPALRKQRYSLAAGATSPTGLVVIHLSIISLGTISTLQMLVEAIPEVSGGGGGDANEANQLEILARLQSASVSSVSVRPEAGLLEITRGVDYHANTIAGPIELPIDSAIDLDGTTSTLTVFDNDNEQVFSKTATIIDDGLSTQRLRVELDDTDTATLKLGALYEYVWLVIDGSDNKWKPEWGVFDLSGDSRT